MDKFGCIKIYMPGAGFSAYQKKKTTNHENEK